MTALIPTATTVEVLNQQGHWVSGFELLRFEDDGTATILGANEIWPNPTSGELAEMEARLVEPARPEHASDLWEEVA